MDCQDWKPVVLNKKQPKGSSTHSLSNQNPTKIKEEKPSDEIPKKTMPKGFGKKMQQARAEKGWSQKELAQKLNCKVSEVQAYEQNKVENPNRKFGRKIEKVLGSPLF